MDDKLDLSCPEGTFLFEGRLKSHLDDLRSSGKHTREELISILLGTKRCRASFAPKSITIIGTREELVKLPTEELEILIAKVTSLVE